MDEREISNFRAIPSFPSRVAGVFRRNMGFRWVMRAFEEERERADLSIGSRKR